MPSMNPKHLIPRLLSGKNQLSRSEKDEIFEKVLSQVAPPERSVWRFAPVLVIASVAALVLVPMAMKDNKGESTSSGFASRGQSSASAAFSVACTNEHATCKTGDTLVFDLSASAGYQYFAAFAKRTDGAVVWYFPEVAAGKSLDLHKRLQDGVLDRGVVLGNDHLPGRYQVYGIFSVKPLLRSEIKERFVAGASELGVGTAVVARELAIH